MLILTDKLIMGVVTLEAVCNIFDTLDISPTMTAALDHVLCVVMTGEAVFRFEKVPDLTVYVGRVGMGGLLTPLPMAVVARYPAMHGDMKPGRID